MGLFPVDTDGVRGKSGCRGQGEGGIESNVAAVEACFIDAALARFHIKAAIEGQCVRCHYQHAGGFTQLVPGCAVVFVAALHMHRHGIGDHQKGPADGLFPAPGFCQLGFNLHAPRTALVDQTVENLQRDDAENGQHPDKYDFQSQGVLLGQFR